MYRDFDEATHSALRSRFDLKQQLSVSGFSSVFVARDRASGEDIAVKIARYNSSEQMLRESEVLKHLDSIRTLEHPNILPIREVGYLSGILFVVMPLVAGPSLRDLLQRGSPFSVSWACNIIAQVCRGLGAAHTRDLIHGHFRPSSVFVSQTDRNEDRVVVGGFERAVFHRPMMGQKHIFMGTPSPYVAPETLMSGDSSLAGVPSDLWSVGVLAYELLTGHLPHHAVAGDLFFIRMRGNPPLDFSVEVPIELRECVASLLRDNPRDRPNSADAVALQLESIRRPRSEDSGWSYDVAISFAGDDRQLARSLSEALRERNVRVFYDEDQAAEMWGKNLADYLPEVYRRRARFCIVLVSRHYAAKAWPNHERRAALDRAIREFDQEYILPIRLDDTSLPGVPESTAYVDAADGVATISDLLVDKLRGPEFRRLPPSRVTSRHGAESRWVYRFLWAVVNWFRWPSR